MPVNRTHDISGVDFHIKDLEKFGHLLEGAANAAFPRRLSRYREVHVLLLSWEDDNLGVVTEVSELRDVFRQVYRYNVEQWRIPSDHSYKALRKQITRFLDEFEDQNNLLIIYYGGRTYIFRTALLIQTCQMRRPRVGYFTSLIILFLEFTFSQHLKVALLTPKAAQMDL